MSESEDAAQSGAGRREVAYRLFAAEFDDADFSYSESDEERAPNYVITPTGARVNRMFVVGVLTEVEQVSDDVLRARIVDPTGAFVVYAGQYQPDEMAFLERASPPMFVALTGKARTFQPEDSDRVFTSVRPESISEVDADTRDRWVVGTAERTLDRVATMADALSVDARGDDLRQRLVDGGVDDGLASGVALGLEHYHTSGAYLDALRSLSLDAARVVAGEKDEVDPLSLAPDAEGEADLNALAAGDVAAAPSEDGTDAAVEEETDTVADQTDAEAGVSEPAATTDSTATEPDVDQEPVGSSQTATAAEDAGEATTGDTADVAATETDSAEADTSETDTAAVDTSESSDTGVTDSAARTETTTDTADDETASVETSETVSTEPATDVDAGADADDDIGDFEPGEFDLDDDEREEIESEFGTEFQSGTEVDEPGEAGIEPEAVPEQAEPDAEPEPSAEPDAEPEPESEQEAAPEPEPAEQEVAEPAEEQAAESAEEAAEPAEDVDLEAAVMDAMRDIDDGDGAAEEDVVAAVVDEYAFEPADVEDAIQEALMDGLCYEPNDGVLKPI
ncbi:hypothetical protein VB779_06020 [Haloarculaceae archaeon H-GB11]|nr:hypothetical protein [Haloarculaceae archaeon H-GB11]